MAEKATYRELEQRIQELEIELAQHKETKDWLKLFSYSFESSLDGLAMGNTESRITYVNETFEKMFGYSQEELVGKRIAFIYADDQIPLLEEALKSTMEGGWTGELIGKKKDGTRFPVLISSSLVQDDKGNTVASMASHRDITQEKKIVEALRKSEAQKQAILDASIDIIRLVDKDMRILWANRTHERYRNIAPEDLIGKTCHEVFVGRKRPCLECSTKMALKSGNREHTVLTRSSPENAEETIYLDTYAVPIKDEFSNIAHCVQVTRDITEQLKAEKLLRKSEEKYRTILENINEGYYEADIKGNFTFFNDALCTILGYSRDELMNMKDRRFIDVKTSKRTYKTFSKVYKTGKTNSLVGVKIIRKDGKTRTIETSVSLMKDTDDHPTGFRGIIRDVTERIQAEKKLRKRELELESLNKQLISTNKALSILARNLNVTQRQSEKRVIQRIRKYIIPVIERLQKSRSIRKSKTDLNLLNDYVKKLEAGLGSNTHIDLSLTSGELRVAALIQKGMSSREIAKQLYISPPTVATHRRNIRKKLDLHHSGMNLKAYMKSEFGEIIDT